MGTTSTVFCWVGGVITPSISETVIEVLRRNHPDRVDFGKRALIYAQTQEFIFGKIDFPIFCRKVNEIIQGSHPANEVESAILDSIQVRLPVIEVLCELPPVHRIWLISDFPPEWFTRIANEIGPILSIPSDRVVFVRDAKLVRLIPDLYDYLVRTANEDISDCMMISADSKLTVEAIRHGLSSEVFVDARRLRKEFKLRKMLPA
jgi:hypothetical protein